MNFIVYTKSGCTFCDKIKNVFNMTKQSFIEYELDIDFSKEEFITRFGNSSFPQVMIDGNNIGGCQETISFLKEQKII